MRLTERDARVKAIRAEHEATAAKDQGATVRQNQIALIWRALEDKARTEAEMFAAIQDRRCEWEAITEPTRRKAIASDLELRRRNPSQDIDPLRAHQAESQGLAVAEPAASARQQVWVQPTLDGTPHLPADQPATSDKSVASPEHWSARMSGEPDRDAAIQLALGLTPQTAHHEVPEYVRRLAEQARAAGEKLDELRHTPEPHPESDELLPSHPWAVLADRDRDAVLQPPKPEVVPSRDILRRHSERAEPHHAEAERS